jgi:hypothetical protein
MKRPVLYHTCTCYNCLPEDEPSGSKYVSVEDIVKIKLYFNRGALCWSTLCD